MNHHHTKKPIIIWGCNEFAQQLHTLLNNTIFHVIGFIDDSHRATTFCGLPAWTPSDFINNTVLQTIPMVIATSHTMLFRHPIPRAKDIANFKEKIQEIIHDYGIQNPLLHPAALSDDLPISYRNKIILFGLQGSGNVIFHHVFQAIYKKYLLLFLPMNRMAYFFETMCREYMHITRQVVSDVIHFNGGYRVHAISWKIGTSHFNFQMQKHSPPISIYTFSTREHITAFGTIYHQIPSIEYLQKLQTKRYKTFFIMRNPLDIILSGLNKSAGVHSDNTTLDDIQFRCISRWVIDQLTAWHDTLPHLIVLTYESLLAQPVATIKKMMKLTIFWSSSRVAKNIWKKLGFQQLPNTFKQHFWQGGSDKWEQYFNNNHLLFLQSHGIENILEKYQYQDVLTKFRARLAAISPEEQSQHYDSEALLNIPRSYYRDEHFDTWQFLQETEGKENCLRSGAMYVVCKEAALRETITSMLDNHYLNNIVLAGAYPEDRVI
jgi:hypothetical protein